MSNSLSPLQSGLRYRLDGSRILDHATDGLIIAAEHVKGSAKNDRYYLNVRDDNLDYFMSDKRLGSMDAGHLLDIGWRNVELADKASEETSTPELTQEYYELAASAFLEAAMRQTFDEADLIEEVDERLRIVDLSEECLRLALDSLPEEQTATKQRLQLKLLFGQAHRDIVCGEVTDATVEEIVNALETELYATIENVDEIHARGLAGEIRAYWTYWSHYHETKQVTIPATVRGDSGFYNRHDTHDIEVLSQNSGGNWDILAPIEIKRRKIADWMLKRYTGSDLVYVHPAHGVTTVQKAKTA